MSQAIAHRFRIGSRSIGPGSPCFVIAEAGVNHNGDVETACALIRAAKYAGADAVKFQTFTPELLASSVAKKADYQLKDREDETHFEMLKRLCLNAGAWGKLRDVAAHEDIIFFSTPFDEPSLDILMHLDVPALKLSSGELTNLPFLERVGSKGKPVLMSTGMGTMAEVTAAVQAICVGAKKDESNVSLGLLHCVSNYPATPEASNLRAMRTLAERFALPIGYSDHSVGIEVAVASVCVGACILEKHFTLDQDAAGPDHKASLEPEAFKEMVHQIRRVEILLGDGEKKPNPSEIKMREVARKSLFWARNVVEGTRVEPTDFVALRPGTGLSPASLHLFVGRTTQRLVSERSMVCEEDFVAEDGSKGAR